MNLSTSASELDVPIGLAVDFADELEFELGLSSVQDKPVSMSVSSPRLSSVQMSPSPSQISTGGNMTSLAPNSPTSTAYMTSPPTSPTPMSFAPDTRPDSDSECEEEGTIDSNSAVGLEKGKAPMAPPRHDTKGKSRAIPTPKLPFRDLSLHEFQTPPDTTFGTPSGSGVGSTGTRSRSRANNTMLPADESTRDLPSIMPLGPSSSSSNSSEPEIDVTPRPSRIRSRALSGLSFSSLRDAVNSHRKSMSRQPSITISGTSSPTPSLARRLSLKGLSALIRRKKDRDGSRSRSGLSSEVASGVSTPASPFLTPSSTVARRNGGNARVCVTGAWEGGPSGSSGEDTASTAQQDDAPPAADPIPKAEQEVVSRPVRGRADTVPTSDYFGFTFGFEDEEEEKEKPDVDEPSREDTSDVLVRSSDTAQVDSPPQSSFSTLPRELHLLILVHLARSYVDDHARAIQGEAWSTTKAGSIENKWVGEAAGLRAIIGMARVSRAWYSLAYDGSFWSQIKYASILPPRPGVPSLANWIPHSIRAQAKMHPTPADLEEQDERLMRLIQTAGPCLTNLDMRGFTRFNAGHVERVVQWVSVSTVEVPRSNEEGVLPVRSLLSLTRYDTLPDLPSKTTNLTRLILSSCFQLTSQSLHALLSASPHLIHLEMRALEAVADETCSILSSHCRSITHLDISRCTNLGPEALTHICGIARPHIRNTGLLKLKSLNMAGYAYVDSTSLRRLGDNLGHTLETLNLAGAWGVSDSAIAAYAEIQPTAAQIEKAKVAEIERWARTRTRAKSKARRDETEETQVEFVVLTAREAGLDPTLAGPFYRRRTALRHLNLSNCRRLTDVGLASLAYAVPRLEILEVSGIAGIGQPGMAKLMKTCKDIKRLDLEETLVGDSVLEVLTPPMEVEDEQEEDLDEESIHIALKADKSHPGHALTHLTLSHCASTQLTSEAVAQLIRACPKLKVLSVDGTQIDDRVVRFFVCAAQARGLLGAEIGATDTRHVARAGLPPPTSTRPRRGVRDWESRGMGYVDGRDWEEGEDECDERRVVLKTYWSWQGVDATLERRRISSVPGINRRNTDGGNGGSGIRGNGPRWRARERDTRGGCVVM
ncbi:hypothetical protein RhiTH_007774 [Rhizoctonia solani]